jgi:glyoxylase-like metal-dependent hydrolase (beta-lactamase superfamily II)
MKRAGIHIFSVVVGLLVIMATLAAAQAPGGQGEEPRVDTIPVSQLSIKTTKLTDNLYILHGIAPGHNHVTSGRYGGTIAVLTGPDGIFQVDAQYPPKEVSEKVLAAIRQFSNAPIRYIVNTHFHGDHTGGNDFFVKMGATVLSQPSLRQRLVNQQNYPMGGRPKVTYQGPVTYYMNGEEIQLIPVGPAHTDGDTYVYFKNADVFMMGDIGRASYPNGNKATGGGDTDGLIEAFGIAIGLGGPNTKYMAGHGPTYSRADLMAYQEAVRTARNRIWKLIQEGKTVDEVIAARPTADLDDKFLKQGFGHGDAALYYDAGTYPRFRNSDVFVRGTYDMLKPPGPAPAAAPAAAPTTRSSN